MTIKQLLIGSLVGATALAAMLHRLPKQNTEKTSVKLTGRSSARLSNSPRKHTSSTERLSLNKTYG